MNQYTSILFMNIQCLKLLGVKDGMSLQHRQTLGFFCTAEMRRSLELHHLQPIFLGCQAQWCHFGGPAHVQSTFLWAPVNLANGPILRWLVEHTNLNRMVNPSPAAWPFFGSFFSHRSHLEWDEVTTLLRTTCHKVLVSISVRRKMPGR